MGKAGCVKEGGGVSSSEQVKITFLSYLFGVSGAGPSYSLSVLYIIQYTIYSIIQYTLYARVAHYKRVTGSKLLSISLKKERLQ